MKKRLEVEVFLDNILRLEGKGEVTVSDSLQPELLTEANKTRGSYRGRILTKELRDAAKRLRHWTDITIK